METCQTNVQTEASIRIYDIAKSCLGKSLVPVGDDPDLGCAISLTVLLNKAGINIRETVSTAQALVELETSPLFKEVSDPLPGDVIISASGTSSIENTSIKNGHCGVVAIYPIGDNGIMSNNSLNGLWQEVYTLSSWNERYKIQGGYLTRFFRAL